MQPFELVHEELTSAPPASSPLTALVAAQSPPASAPVPLPPSSSGGGSGGGGGNCHRRRGSGSRGTGGGGGSPNGSGGSSAVGHGSSGDGAPPGSVPPTGAAVWSSVYNPWTGTIQMWPGPVQGARFGAGLPWPAFAGVGGPSWPGLTAWPAPATHPGPPTTAVPGSSTAGLLGPAPGGGLGPWDQQTLAGAFHTMTLTPPAPSGEWYMDTGATSHMASTSGSQDSERDHQVAPLPVYAVTVPPGAVPVPPTVNDHIMLTRAKSGFKQPRLNLHADTLSPVPDSFHRALADPNWRSAMEEEFQALLALSNDWPVHQLDVKNAFLHGTLTETVYYSQPSGFVDTAWPNHVCRLNKSLYGLKQGSATTYLLLYVDDIVLTASTTTLLHQLLTSLQSSFPMKDLGPLQHFLGIAVTRSSTGMLLCQRQYALDILVRAGTTNCKPCNTPMDTQAKLSSAGTPVADPTLYRSLVGVLQYLTFTRPDITYAVQQVCLHMHDPCEPHLTAVKRIIRYLQGTADLGLFLGRSSPSVLTVYTDADWASCPDTRHSTSGYAVFLGDNLISWSSKRQPTVSRSSAEAEYCAVANGVTEASWLRQLLHELHHLPPRATLVYCDNVSAVYLSSNLVQHQRTKHIEVDLHFVRERVTTGAVRVLHVPMSSQFADLFTKGLPSTVFLEFRSSGNLQLP
ncbi:hypothetical protein U9M48_027464 [Paspalum notatum var. saurae]|uniref:Reverse transcriptase Ty1/copia-type domain-containing protein n=1 Tax=Paspalum notatum var. saurae TaxID=547442 RepID=A0AAQ3TXB1_PASNO